MIKKSIVGLVVCLLFVTNAWALTPVLDTGDSNERVCNPKSYTDLGNGIVRDNVTGLEWVQDGNLIASRDPDFDNDDMAGDGQVTWQHALDFIDLLNAGGFLGHRDWRLPTIQELSTLVDNGREDPAIDPIFNGALSLVYWSSTTYPVWGSPWHMNFYDGYVTYSSGSNYVRVVRGKPYSELNNFVINGDGTVTDTTTGLMWQQCNYGQTWDGTQCGGNPERLHWDAAGAYIQGLNDAHHLGYEGWRLPTKNELQTLLDYSRDFPATTFPDTLDSYYWSSTTYARFTWYVDFMHGQILSHYTESSFLDVRAVRGGLCWIDTAECLADSDCAETEGCRDNVCVCELVVTHKQISSEKLTKPRKVVLNITSANEAFDVFGRIDLGPLSWEKVKFNRKKNQLKIHAIVPAGLKPGIIPIRVGDCFGEVVITGTDR